MDMGCIIAILNYGVPTHYGMPPSTPFWRDEELCAVETNLRLPESSHTGPWRRGAG